MISWIQAVLLGLISCCAASTIACLGTAVGNYTLNKPLIASIFIGLVLGDVRGRTQIAVPMQIIYVALVTPDDTVAADLCAVSYIGISLAWALVKSRGLDLGGPEANGLTDALGTMVGAVGTVQFYRTAMMDLVWQHTRWARLDKKDFSIVGKVEVILPLISHLLTSFTSVTLIIYYGVDAVDQSKEALPTGSWYVRPLFTSGSLLLTAEIAVLLKSVVDKAAGLIFFLFGFTLAGSMHLILIAAAAIGAVFALINYQMTVIRNRVTTGPAGINNDEEDI